MFSLQSGEAKLYGKMFIFIILILIDICIGRCYANFRLIFAYIIINMPLCYVTDTLAYVYKEADVIAFDCMADVITMFSSIEQMLNPYLVYVYQKADVIAFLIILADVIAMFPYILHYQICILQW